MSQKLRFRVRINKGCLVSRYSPQTLSVGARNIPYTVFYYKVLLYSAMSAIIQSQLLEFVNRADLVLLNIIKQSTLLSNQEFLHWKSNWCERGRLKSLEVRNHESHC
jgi:hypothetical protein